MKKRLAFWVGLAAIVAAVLTLGPAPRSTAQVTSTTSSVLRFQIGIDSVVCAGPNTASVNFHVTNTSATDTITVVVNYYIDGAEGVLVGSFELAPGQTLQSSFTVAGAPSGASLFIGGDDGSWGAVSQTVTLPDCSQATTTSSTATTTTTLPPCATTTTIAATSTTKHKPRP